MFINTTLQAVVHLGKAYDTNLRHAKNHLWNSLGQIFDETKRLISDQSEILGSKTPEIVGLKTIEFKETTWRSTSLLCESVYQITHAKVHIFSDSVLCVEEMGDDPNAASSTARRRSSSGKYSQDSRRWDPRRETKIVERDTV